MASASSGPGTAGWRSRRSTSSARELAVVVAMALAAFSVSTQLELFEHFVSWSRAHEGWDADEVVVALVISVASLSAFSWRRFREVDAEARRLEGTEKALLDAERRARSLFDFNPLPIVSLDSEGRLVEVNTAAEQMTGYQADELEGVHFNALINPEDQKFASAAFTKVLRGDPLQVDVRIVDKNGADVELRATAIPIVVAGEVVGTYDMVEDVTAANRLQRDLERTTRAAEAANEAKSLFLANMSHEVRTPLTTLLAATEILSDTQLDTSQRQLLARMSRSGDRLLRLVDELLDFSRIEAGAIRIQHQPFKLATVVAEAAEQASQAAAAKNLGFRSLIEPNVPAVVEGDAGRLLQVLGNLLSNAVKFTDDGTISLTVSRSTGEPGRADGSEVHGLRFAVTDTGIGVQARDQQRVFESFAQADPSMTRRHEGSGLGLAICKQLVTQMGGTIWVESVPGEGSTFAFSLPLVASTRPV
jgi:PAS domain S-box-containing protein